MATETSPGRKAQYGHSLLLKEGLTGHLAEDKIGRSREGLGSLISEKATSAVPSAPGAAATAAARRGTLASAPPEEEVSTRDDNSIVRSHILSKSTGGAQGPYLNVSEKQHETLPSISDPEKDIEAEGGQEVEAAADMASSRGKHRIIRDPHEDGEEAVSILKADTRSYDTISRRPQGRNGETSRDAYEDEAISPGESISSPTGAQAGSQHLDNPPVVHGDSPTTSPTTAKHGKRKSSASVGGKRFRKVKSGRTAGIYQRFVENWGSRELENKGSVARDHLALERTFLAWLRTSLAFASIGVAVAQLFRLSSAVSGSNPSISQQHLSKYGKPLGVTFLAIAIVVLLLGFQRYFESQHWIIKGKFPASRGSIFTVSLVTIALIIASFVAIILSSDPTRSN